MGFLTKEMAEFIVPMTNPAGPEMPALPGGDDDTGTGPLEVGVSCNDLSAMPSSGADLEAEPVSRNSDRASLLALFKPKGLGSNGNGCPLQLSSGSHRLGT